MPPRAPMRSKEGMVYAGSGTIHVRLQRAYCPDRFDRYSRSALFWHHQKSGRPLVFRSIPPVEEIGAESILFYGTGLTSKPRSIRCKRWDRVFLSGKRNDFSRGAWRRIYPMNDNIILLVEDNPDDESLTMRALKNNNLSNELVVARDGAQALEYLLSDSHPLPALVLLDLKLPKIDGLEVLRRLRTDARTRLVNVVILTGSEQERDLVAGYNLGANSYVQKPVDFEQFPEAVRQLGLYWLVVNKTPKAKAGF